VGLVENMLGGSAYKLGDVLRARSGKTDGRRSAPKILGHTTASGERHQTDEYEASAAVDALTITLG